MPYKDPERHRLYREQRNRDTVQFYRDYKVSQGCADCGYNEHHAGLEFDHVGNKFLNISAMANYSRARLLEEMSKCEVVCGTCHNIRGFNRGQHIRGGRTPTNRK